MEIDPIGKLRSEWYLDDFVKFYLENKEAVDKIPTCTLNQRVRIVDKDGHPYRIHRHYGKMRLVRVADNDMLTKHDMINQILRLYSEIYEMKKLLDDINRDSDMDIRRADKFEENLLRSIQDQARQKRQKV